MAKEVIYTWNDSSEPCEQILAEDVVTSVMAKDWFSYSDNISKIEHRIDEVFLDSLPTGQEGTIDYEEENTIYKIEVNVVPVKVVKKKAKMSFETEETFSTD